MKSVVNEMPIQSPTLDRLWKREANLSAIQNGDYTVSARKMRRIEKALARKSKNKKSYTVTNA